MHFLRNALAHAGKSGRRVVAAFIATAFAQDHAEAAKAQWRQVADHVRPKLPKLAALLDPAASVPSAPSIGPHRSLLNGAGIKAYSTSPLGMSVIILTSRLDKRIWSDLVRRVLARSQISFSGYSLPIAAILWAASVKIRLARGAPHVVDCCNALLAIRQAVLIACCSLAE